jgi:hypothetical protein
LRFFSDGFRGGNGGGGAASSLMTGLSVKPLVFGGEGPSSKTQSLRSKEVDGEGELWDFESGIIVGK